MTDQIDAAEARRRYAAKKAKKIAQWNAAGRARLKPYYDRNKAEGSAKVAEIVRLARNGATLEQVATELGNKPSSILSLLRKKLGSGEWPPAKHTQPQEIENGR